MSRTRSALVHIAIFVSVVGLSCLTGPEAQAAGPQGHRVHTPVKRRVWVAGRRAMTSAAIIVAGQSRDVLEADQGLITVRVVGSTVYLDPDGDYLHQGENRIDANHFIPTAQRLHRSLNAKPARVIRRVDHTPLGHRHIALPVVRPRMIFIKPTPKWPKPKPKKTPIPSVPRPPKKQSRLLALATANGMD